MNYIEKIIPEHFALVILCSASIFTFFWFLDSITHGKLVKIEITDKELQTHRTILLTSCLMELSLVLMFWWPIEMLPFFIAFFITRTAHEFIDELHWHTDRCSAYESFLHLGMWLSMLTNTFAMFMWGFFKQFNGIEKMNPVYFVWAGILFICLSWVGFKEWKR